MIEDLTACFDGLADLRVTRQCDHRLIDILVSAVIACAESWKDIELFGRSKQTQARVLARWTGSLRCIRTRRT